MEKKKNNQNPEGFVPGLVMDLLKRRPEEELWEAFEKDYQEQIDDLFFDYLEEVALKEAEEKYPVLKMKIADTDMPEKVKNALQKFPGWLTTVGEVIQYTPSELIHFPGIGPKALEAIKAFLAKHGIDYC